VGYTRNCLLPFSVVLRRRKALISTVSCRKPKLGASNSQMRRELIGIEPSSVNAFSCLESEILARREFGIAVYPLNEFISCSAFHPRNLRIAR